MFTQRLVPLLFIIAPNWKQPRCLLIEEQIHKLWYLYIVESYMTLKKTKYSYMNLLIICLYLSTLRLTD